jgi:RNA polymerase sigma-70 factor (ECF subfamily)
MVRYLVERIRQKDQRAMSQLYKMYVKRLSSVCYRYVPNENDAKDVLQNSFVKIFTTITTIDYQGEEAFWSWMKKVVANEALCYLRERKRLLFVDQELAAHHISNEDEPQPERLSKEELQRLISELPDGYRTVINLHIFEGYPHKKIAELLGITENTSSSQLYFAKRALAKRIKELLNDKQ